MKDNRLYLIHIRDCIQRIKSYTQDGKEAFFAELMIQDAVLRNLEVMCESIKKLPPEWKEPQPQREWNKIVGFRNRLAHEYLSINLDVVWDIIENYLPDLERSIEQIAEDFWHT
jgi:uncharacterized protein with HEPN domain